MDIKKFIAVVTAIISATAVIGGCSADDITEEILSETETEESELDENVSEQPSENFEEIEDIETSEEDFEEGQIQEGNFEDDSEEDGQTEEKGEDTSVLNQQEEAEEQTAQTVTYIMVTGDNVNIRSGAGTGYSSYGKAEKNTLYALCGEQDGWCKTYYKNKASYIYSEYCRKVQLSASENSLIESVIEEGSKLLGTTYVYGATRLHDGNGNFYKGFTVTKFDCSSLMQYIFYYGADYLLRVNTRTQIYQGTTVTKSELQRGDLMFFTNSSRCNNTGIERVGHVALYLGENYILHTSSDYAKIEKLTAARWDYFIQGQRVL